METSPQKPPSKPGQNLPGALPGKLSQITLLKTFRVSAEFGFIIALPLIIFGYLGKYLSAKYHSKFFIVAAILLALACSIGWLYIKINQIIKELKNK